MSNLSTDSFHNCHQFLYNSNPAFALSIPLVIGLTMGIAAFVFTFMKSIEEDKIKSLEEKDGVSAAGFFSMGAGCVIGVSTTFITAIAILILKLVPPRV